MHDNGPDRKIVLTYENHESRNVIITGPDSWKSCTNNTNNNNTDFNNINLINLSAKSASPKIKVVKAQEKEDSIRLREQYEDYLREKLEIDILSQRNPYEVRRINEILEIMIEVLNSKAKTIRISGEDKPTEVVKAQFMKLDSSIWNTSWIVSSIKHRISITSSSTYLPLSTTHH